MCSEIVIAQVFEMALELGNRFETLGSLLRWDAAHGYKSLSFTVLIALFSQFPMSASAEPDSARQAQLQYLLTQDCGSCHGMRLKGGLGPALLPEALRDKPDDVLISTILNGRPGTPMPPWRELLTEEEVRWLVSVLRSGGKP